MKEVDFAWYRRAALTAEAGECGQRKAFSRVNEGKTGQVADQLKHRSACGLTQLYHASPIHHGY